MTVHAWADRHRFLSSEVAAEPGPYRSMRTPYVRGILDAAIDPAFDYVAVKKSSQVGLTEAANNLLGFWIDQDAGPCLYVLPGEDDVREEKNRRIKPMIEQSPQLRTRIPHDGWATDKELTLRGMMVMFAYAGSPTKLSRRPCRYVIVDELDNCEKQSGYLGDTLTLCEARTTTFGFRRKIFLPSTPSTDTGSIHGLGEKCGLTRYYVPCPACGAYQALQYTQIKIPPEERDPDRIVMLDLAHYACEHCGAELHDGEHKRFMIDRGVWLRPGQQIVERLPLDDPAAVDRARLDRPEPWTPRIEGEARLSRTIVFHIWAAYSPWVRWSEIIAKHLKAGKDAEKLRVWSNTVLGEAWVQAAITTEVSEVRRRRIGAHPRDRVPDKALVLTVGADVQQNAVFYVVRGWGPRRQSWLIREGVVLTLEELYEAACRPIECLDGREPLRPAYLAVDSGYNTLGVYEFAKAHAGVFAVKGTDSGMPVRPARVEYTPQGKARPDSIMLVHVNVSDFKERIHIGLRTEAKEAGAFFLHASATDEYCEHLCSEQLVFTKPKNRKGRARKAWQLKSEGAANHFLDCEVYAMAIAEHTGLLNLEAPGDSGPPPADPAPRPPTPYGRRPMGLPLRKFSLR